MTFLRKIPLAVWIALAVAGVFAVQELRLASALRASESARDALFHNALDAIEAQRTTTEQERAALGAARAALQKDVEANRKALKALEGRSQAASATTAHDLVAARELAAHPSYVALEASAGRLGVRIRAAGK